MSVVGLSGPPVGDRQEAESPNPPGGACGRSARTVCYAVIVGLTLAVFWAPLSMLIWFSSQHEHYSHIILVPLVAASLFFLERNQIFSHVETRWREGLASVFAGAVL